VTPAQPLGPEQRLLLLEALGQAVIATDGAGIVTYWNPAAERLYGWSAEEALGREISELPVPEFSQELGAEILASVAAGVPWSGGFSVRRKDGTVFTALVTDTGIRNGAGEVVGLVGVSINIGEMIRPLLTWAHEAVVVTDEAGVVRFASPPIERLIGRRTDELPGRTLGSLVHPQDRDLLAEVLRRVQTEPPGSPTPDLRLLHADGSWTWVEGVVGSILNDPAVRGLVWTLRDVSQRRRALEQMTDVALHDPLTGLPNRALLWDRLTHAIARREPHGALLFLDLDDFKRVNDELGHVAGDQVLRTVGSRLAHLVRPEDSCGRWAGDEFLVLNETLTSRAAATALADRVEHAVSTPVEVAGHVVTPRVSIGIAMLEEVDDAQTVINLADERMYEVKRQHHSSRGSTG
jgi:diguanylate cyclase (GGDEF)-like protein/PAS domain S-box-containing protein